MNFADGKRRRQRAGGFVVARIDGEIIVGINAAVVVEIAVDVTGGLGGVAGIYQEIIVAVDDAVEIGVANVGVFDQYRGRVDGLAVPESGLRAGEAEGIGCLGNAERGEGI